MPGRKYSIANTNYRYGFNGQEKSDEISGEGNAYNFDARMYNPRISRWFSADAKGNAFSSPYNYVQNNPINRVDPDGNDDIYFVFLYDKTIPGLSHLTKFSVIVRNNEPNRYIHRTYFLTSGKGGIGDKVLSPARDKEFYPTNPMSSSGLTSTKVFGFLNADDKDYVTLGKYVDEFSDIKREANYSEFHAEGSAISQRQKNAHFLAGALANNEMRKKDAENEAAGMGLVKGVLIYAASEFMITELFLAEGVGTASALNKSDKFFESAKALDRNGLTKVGRALQKHAGREGSSFSELQFSGKTGNADGMKVLDDILSSKNQLIRDAENGGKLIFDKTTGRGVGVSRNGEFNGFRDIKNELQ